MDQSRAYLTQAAEELAKDDLCQASEKAWGAAATIVKAAADQHGWDHDTHRHLYRAVSRLVDETGDESLNVNFGLAGQLHINFYEGWLGRREVEGHLTQVVKLVQQVEELIAAR